MGWGGREQEGLSVVRSCGVSSWRALIDAPVSSVVSRLHILSAFLPSLRSFGRRAARARVLRTVFTVAGARGTFVCATVVVPPGGGAATRFLFRFGDIAAASGRVSKAVLV